MLIEVCSSPTSPFPLWHFPLHQVAACRFLRPATSPASPPAVGGGQAARRPHAVSPAVEISAVSLIRVSSPELASPRDRLPAVDLPPLSRSCSGGSVGGGGDGLSFDAHNPMAEERLGHLR